MNTTVRTAAVSAAALAAMALGTTAASAADLTTADHHQAVAAVAAAAPADIDTAAVDTPAPVAPATYTTPAQQASTSTGIDIGVGTTGVILLGGLCWYAIKHHNQRWSWMLVSFALGVSLSASVFGSLSTQLVDSGVTAVSNVATSITH